jgi:DNA invertase Pin-like site-specific DNA recombinase
MENEIKNPIGYARTSTKEQDIDLQINLLKAEGIPAERIFFDVGISGSVPALKRQGYKQLMTYAKNNPVDAIFCFEISRLGRTAMETLVLVQELEKSGIKVISLSPSESWSKNVDPLFRDLLIHMLAWVANMEKKVLKERVKAGVQEYRDKHGTWGPRKREPNQVKVEKLLGQGMKLAEIAREMKIPQSTLYKYYHIWQDEKRIEYVEGVE